MACLKRRRDSREKGIGPGTKMAWLNLFRRFLQTEVRTSKRFPNIPVYPKITPGINIEYGDLYF